MKKYSNPCPQKARCLILLHMIMLLLLLIPSCALDNFSPAGVLTPPLVLHLSKTNISVIVVRFTGLNPEAYFLGYNIYLGETHAEVTNRLYPLTNLNGELPSMRVSEFSVATTFTNIVINNTSGARGGATLAGTNWYVGVGAYGNDNGDIVYSEVVVVSNIGL